MTHKRAHAAGGVSRRRAGKAAAGGLTIFEPFAVAFLTVGASYLAGDWIAGLGIVVLWTIWRLLSDAELPPVLPLAVSFQWVQVTCGIYYLALTGRELETHYASDYRPMVLMGLGCVLVLTVGLALGLKLGSHHFGAPPKDAGYTVSWRTLFIAYIGATISNAVVHEIAFSVPGLTQGLLALGFARLGVLFLMFRRLVRPRLRWEWFAGILAFELLLGFTGYFAGFREPLALAALALLEVFRPRSVMHWARLGAVGALSLLAGMLWMGVRSVYRSEIDAGQLSRSRVERLGRVGELSTEWISRETDAVLDNTDRLVDRLWVVYYPALAVARVPEVLPHEGGAIMWAALKHLVTPRILFPDKGNLVSDSEMVRKYAGVFVAGPDQGTTIAFGYAAEAYVDFGLPLMFLPSLVFGMVMGFLYRLALHLIQHRELGVGLVSVVFWLSLYLFERSWVRTLGLSLTILITVGGLTYVIDRLLLSRRVAYRRRRRRPYGRLQRTAGRPA